MALFFFSKEEGGEEEELEEEFLKETEAPKGFSSDVCSISLFSY